MAYPKKRADFMNLPTKNIAEIYSSGLQFALASDKHEQACHFVFCKDFFQDAYQGYFNKKSRSIYSFSYDPKKNRPLSEKSFNIFVLNASDKDFHTRIPGAHDFMVQVERAMKMKQKTEVFEVSTLPDWAVKKGVRIFMFKSNKRWYASPVMISLYTLLVRVAFLHKEGRPYKETINRLCSGKIAPYQNNDRGYMQTGAIGLAHILKHGDRKVFGRDLMKNFPADLDIHTMHNSMGIVAYSQGSCQTVFPNWYTDFKVPAQNPFGTGSKFNFKV